jgi:hypothetical protein
VIDIIEIRVIDEKEENSTFDFAFGNSPGDLETTDE